MSGSSGGSSPRWCRDGRTVLYIDGAKIMEATLERGRETVSARHIAFPLPFAATGGAITRIYALAPDERHGVLVRPNQQATPPARRLLVIPNWIEELKAKVRAAK